MSTMTKGEETRSRVMDIAEASILSKGFGGTSIDEIIEGAEITKSGFFYHFQDKGALALALLERYIEREDKILDGLFERAAELNDDPLHSFLIGLKLMAEMMADLPNGHPGCLVANYCYNERLFDLEIKEMSKAATLSWQQRFLSMLERANEQYELTDEVDLADVAAMLSCVVDGGIIASRALQEPKVLAKQVMLYRSYIKLLFRPRQDA